MEARMVVTFKPESKEETTHLEYWKLLENIINE